MEKLIRMPPQTESSKPQADSNAHTESDSLIEYMKERGIPITFRNYLGILYLNPNHELTPEQEADLPPELWEGEQDENPKTNSPAANLVIPVLCRVAPPYS